MNETFKEKETCRVWATHETQKTVVNAVMAPLIISHDGDAHRDSVRRWKDFAPDVEVD